VTKTKQIVVRALKSVQGKDVEVFAFFLPGGVLLDIADISRIGREDGKVKGFQRGKIPSHVKSIVDYLDSGDVLFPNAIILALSPEIEFKFARGSRPEGMLDVADSGTLTIPVLPDGKRVAWIVDGQQRSLALAQSKNREIPVPVVGFVSPDLATQREQFLLVNQGRGLPPALINELLPEVAATLPRHLAVRKLPSELVNLLNKDPISPFMGLIRRESNRDGDGVITDTALIEAIKGNLKRPFGALSQYKRDSDDEGSDADSMYRTLVLYWQAVRDSFPEAWGRAPTESRLMHSAGIRAMGALMDAVMLRADASGNTEQEVRRSLARLAPHCAWTSGKWADLDLKWNEIQATPQDINRLRDHLIHLDRELARGAR
jgi:DGQHR domain-containing protein